MNIFYFFYFVKKIVTEQKAVIEFNFKLDKTTTEMYESIAYDSDCLLR